MDGDMTDNGQGFTVKELVVSLTAKVDTLLSTQSAQHEATQRRIEDLRVDLATHKALPAHEGAAAQLAQMQASISTLARHDDKHAGERAGSDRTWKIIAAVAGIPGIAALAARLFAPGT